MKKMNYATSFIDGYNAIAGTVVAILSYILGEHWLLFVAFLLLNVGKVVNADTTNKDSEDV